MHCAMIWSIAHRQIVDLIVHECYASNSNAYLIIQQKSWLGLKIKTKKYEAPKLDFCLMNLFVLRVCEDSISAKTLLYCRLFSGSLGPQRSCSSI